MKEIIQHLASDHSLLESLVEHLPIRIFWKDHEQRYLGCNTLFATDAGFEKPDDLIGKTDYEMGWKEQAELYRADDQQVIDSGESKLLYVEPQTTPDGNTIWLRTSKVPLQDENGEIFGVLGIYEDITDQKQMEEDLEHSEQRFKDLFEKSPDPCWIINNDNLFVLCNQTAADILGYDSIEELKSTHPSKLSPETQPDGHPSFDKANAMMAVAHEKGIHRFEWEHKRKNGDCFPVEVTLSRVDLNGKPQLYCVWRNISEQKKAELQLQQEVKFNQQLLSQASEGIVVWRLSHSDAFAEFTIWNRQMETITGYTQKEINTIGWLNVIYKDDEHRELARKTMLKVLHGEDNRDFVGVTKSGEKRTFHISSSPILGINDEPCVLAIVEDVTELRRKQLELELSQKRFQTLFDSSTDGIFILDMEGNFVDLNKTAHKRLGYTKEEMLASCVSELDLPEFRAKVPQRMKEIMEQGRSVFESAHYRKDGSIMPVEINARLLDLDDQKVVLSIVRDISERKTLEDRLRQSQKMEAIGTLVGGIAHDFNNTLAAVEGNLYLAKKQLHEHPVIADRLANIETLTLRAAETVRQLLTFARKDIVSMTVFNVNDFMEEGFKLAKTVIPENIDHQTYICEEPLFIRGDANQLQQAMFNLLNNAVDAVEEVAHPQVSCHLNPFEADEAMMNRLNSNHRLFARISVKDNGMGIEKTIIEKIFEPFFTTKEVGKGSGLGLSMLYGTVQSHHGIVEIESEPGCGTLFDIYIPLCEPETAEASDEKSASLSGEGYTILLVDDEKELCETTAKVLLELGYHIHMANDGTEALQLFKSSQQDIDLILSDVVMPRMGGEQLLNAVREIDREIPVILTTGYDDKVISKNYRAHACRVIPKPFDFDKLSQTIHEMLKPKDD